MNITARYNPRIDLPLPPPGFVSLTMSDSEANKLRALLGKCNGNEFDTMYSALHIALCHPSAPKQLFLNYMTPTPDGVKCIDLQTTFKFNETQKY